jgi:hypothetical protein
VNPSRIRPPRHLAAILAVAILVIAVALPVLAASPSPSVAESPSVLPGASVVPAPSVAPSASPRAQETRDPAESDEPEASDQPEESDDPQEADESKESEAPEVQVTIRGTVKSAADAEGQPDFTLEANGKTLKLDAGPKWFHGANNPLLPFVGKTVTVVGEQSGDEVDVLSVDGIVIRAPGRPPWAGGWKVQGKIHPGWSQEKADRWAAKQKAKEAARAACIAAGQTPDQCKGHDGDDENESSAPAETPGIG